MKKQLLLVESDSEMTQLFIDFLKGHQKCVLDVACNAQETFELLSKQTYHMLLASNRILGMAPKEFFDRVAVVAPGIELVLMSHQYDLLQKSYYRGFKNVHALPVPVVLQDLWTIIDGRNFGPKS